MNKLSSWFYKRDSVKKLWIFGTAILSITLLSEVWIHLHAYFQIVDFFAFNALFGFLSCVLMVLFAKLLGYLIKRKEDYYHNE